MTQRPRSRFDFTFLADTYDNWYDTPAGRRHDRDQKAAACRLLPGSPVVGSRLLDVGCGTGHWSRFFAELGHRTFGVDICPEMVAVARRRVAVCDFAVADGTRLPFAERRYNVIAAMTALEFSHDPQALVAEMVRCTASDGIVLIGTLNRLAPLNRERLARRREPYASACLLSATELHDLLRPHGRVAMTGELPAGDAHLATAELAPMLLAALHPDG